MNGFDYKNVTKSKTPIRLTLQQEIELFDAYHSGSTKAFYQLIDANLENTVNLTLNFARKTDIITFDELLGEANYRLIRCVKKYQHKKGFRFYSYLSKALSNAFVNLINLHKTIVIPNNKMIEYGKISQGLAEPTLDYELYSNMQYSIIGNYQGDDETVDVLDENIEYSINHDDLVVAIDLSMEVLLPVEVTIIKMYFGIDQDRAYQLGEIGEHLGVSKNLVHMKKKKAIVKLKRMIGKFL